MPARPFLSILPRTVVYRIALKIASPRYQLLHPHLATCHKILDVGLGMGVLAHLMQSQGFTVTGLDVDNTSLFPDLQPTLYDGSRLPYAANSFDTATVICVLHHCQNQEQLLKEVMRVSRRALILEDTYRHPLEHLLIALRDSLENWEFYRHQYRSYPGWKDLCLRHGWQVKHLKSWVNWDFGLLYGHQTLFMVEQH